MTAPAATQPGSDLQLWLLLAGDAATGLATRPVGVLGLDGDRHHISWLPLEPAADGWRQRLVAPAEVPLAERVAFWAEHANGTTVDLAPIAAPEAGSLCDAVEACVDELLAAGAGE